MVFSYLKKVILTSITVASLVLFGIVPAASAVNILDLSAPINVSFLGQEGEYQRISWMPPNVNKTGETITNYKIFYTNMWDQNNDKGEILVDGDSLEALIPMKPSTWYSIKITAITPSLQKGGVVSPYYDFTTSPPAATRGYAPIITAARPVSTSLIDKDKVKVTWEQPYMDRAREADIREYRIELDNKVIATVPFPSTQAIVTIPNYKENTRYKIGVGSYRWLAGGIHLAATAFSTYYITPMDSYYSCDDIEVMTARGSGEPYWNEEDGTIIKGTEEQTLLTNEQIAEELPGYTGSVNGSTETVFAETLKDEISNMSKEYTVNSYAVPYPASRAIIDINDTWDSDKFWENNPLFGQSINIGTEMVTDRITQIRNLCPGTKIILSGYSQGALVMGNAIDALAKQDTQVDSVVLFGDPFFNPTDLSVDRSNYIPLNAGMLADRDFWSDVTSSPVTSYCHSFDVFCNITNIVSKTWDASVFVSAAAISGGNVYGPHEAYPLEWEPDNNRQAAVEGAWQAAEDLKMAFAAEN